MVCKERKKWNSAVANRGWQLKGIKRNPDKGKCNLCLGEEDIKPLLLNCLETKKWRMKFLTKQFLSMNKEVAYRKRVRCLNKDQIRNLGRYLDRVQYRRFNKTK